MASIQARRSETACRDSWSIDRSLIVTASASGRSRFPSQPGHGLTDMYFSSSVRIACESVSL
jgi:hypothetical protein